MHHGIGRLFGYHLRTVAIPLHEQGARDTDGVKGVVEWQEQNDVGLGDNVDAALLWGHLGGRNGISLFLSLQVSVSAKLL